MDMIEIKPCPFCNAEVEYITTAEAQTSSMDLEWQVCCSTCGMCGPTSTLKALAIERWNNLPRLKKEVRNEP